MSKAVSFKYLLPILIIISAPFIFWGYDDGLPVLEQDEGIVLSQSVLERGISDFEIQQVPGYPPLLLFVFDITQRVVESFTGESVLHHSATVIRIVRFTGAVLSIFVVYFIYKIAEKMGYPLAGFLAGLAWVVFPEIHLQTRLALTESWQLFFISFSAWAMLKSLETEKLRWALLSTILGLLTVLAKYGSFPVLGLGVGTSFWLLISRKNKLHSLKMMLLQIAMMGITAYWLVFIYGVNRLVGVGHQSARLFLSPEGLGKLIDLSSIAYIFGVVSNQLSLIHLGLLTLILGLGTILFWRSAKADLRVAWFYLLIFSLSFVWLVPSFLVYDVLKYRYLAPATSALVLLLAVSLLIIAHKLSKRASILTYLVLAILWFLPTLPQRLTMMWNYQYPITDNVLVEWSKASLEPGTLAITGIVGTTWYWRHFNNLWGNYLGPNRPLEDILLYLQEPMSSWDAAGIEYVHLTGNYPGDYPTLPFPIEEMLFLKAVPALNSGEFMRGEPWYIYRLHPYQYESGERLGEGIILRGYDLSADSVVAGESISIRTFWQAEITPSQNYHLYLHLYPMDERAISAQADGTPGLETRPTSSWTDPSETLISAEYEILIPAELETGSYRLALGLYEPQTGQRLLDASGSDFLVIHFIEVQAQP